MKYEVLIRGARLATGDGSPCRPGDLAIAQGRIAEIAGAGELKKEEAARVVEGDGLVLTPGFIDVHAHSEISVWQRPDCLPKISQGVTTELSGQCGISAVPAYGDAKREIMDYTGIVLGESALWPWENLQEYQKTVAAKGIAINQGNFIGHGNLRINAMSFDDRKPTEKEMSRMKALLRQELAAGAFGLTSGLVYAPGMYSDMDEMAELARLCAAAGGIYTTHMRGDGAGFLEAVAEALEVGRRSGVQVNLSHLKVMGKANHGQIPRALELMEEAASEGLKVTADCYPYDASYTTLTLVLPPWSMARGIAGLLEFLQDPEKRQQIKADIEAGLPGWDNRAKSIGWDRIRVGAVLTEKNRCWEGLSLAEAAAQKGREATDFAMDLLLEEEGQINAVYQGMDSQDVAAALASPRVMVCSDGVDVGEKTHPRLYGTFPRYLSHYADLSCDEGIGAAAAKLCGLPARIYGLKEMGLLLPGYWADLALFDPQKLKDTATYAQPRQLAQGISQVWVSGCLAYAEGQATGKRPGRFLHRQGL